MFMDLKKFVAQRMIFTASEVYPNLYQASKIQSEEDVEFIKDLGIRFMVDLEGGFDPPMDFLYCYVLWSIRDLPFLPDLDVLLSVSTFVSMEVSFKHKVLVHCSQGLNRSGLVCARAMTLMGIPGPEAIKQIREKRPGALWNPVFADYVEGL
jgi:hypothetical protein